MDGRLCRPLVDFLGGDLVGRTVVEIGPGGGVLTRELLTAGARVWGVELDLAWAAALANQLTAADRLQLLVADGLELPWGRLPADTLVAGNLPYNVATAIIGRLLRAGGGVPRAAFLVQLEVAERLAASAGDDAYGALSVLAATHAEVSILGRVKAGSFRPPPKVESAWVGFVRHPPPLPASGLAGLETLVFAAFSQRRKTLRNALTARYGRERAAAAVACLAGRGFPSTVRGEDLGLEDFLALHKFLCDSAAELLD